MREYKDSSGRLSIDLSDSASWFLFRWYAWQIKKKFNAKIIGKLNDVDQRWWDFKVKDKIVVLHSESIIGISIHIEDGTNDGLLREIVATLLKKEGMISKFLIV